jgi:hypothetical protein
MPTAGDMAEANDGASMRKTLLRLAALTMIVQVSPAIAQTAVNTQQAVEAFKGRGPEMDRLASMAGQWRIAVETYRPKLQRWEAAGAMSTVIHSRYDGRYIEAELAVPLGEYGYTTAFSFSFDKFRRKYRLIIIENFAGLADVMEGNFEGNVLGVDNLSTGTMGPNIAGKLEANRFELAFADTNTMALTVFVRRHDAWLPAMRFNFQRMLM